MSTVAHFGSWLALAASLAFASWDFRRRGPFTRFLQPRAERVPSARAGAAARVILSPAFGVAVSLVSMLISGVSLVLVLYADAIAR